ncbi:MAG: hypothetical protein JSW50_01960 [Candidatus Latescibacterota bacterium]|nr:MAG: hypothetical protein JSW50_01960 [Candidatus Latescibacterota bacterium]
MFTCVAIFLAVALAWVPAPAQIVDLCGSTAMSAGGCLVTCPEGDGYRLSDIGATIQVTVVYQGEPVPNIPATDFWLIECDPVDELILCGGSQSASADGPTDAAGQTTISGTIAAGGCAESLALIVQGVLIYDPSTNCETILCLPIKARSPDLNLDLVVNLSDLALFAVPFSSGVYDACADFNCDQKVGLQDLSTFAFHYGPPGHSCFP